MDQASRAPSVFRLKPMLLDTRKHAPFNSPDWLFEIKNDGYRMLIREAVPFLEALAKQKPDDVGVLYNLGIAYSELGQYDEAIIRLKRAVQLNPEHAHAWTGIGVAYQRRGMPEQALEPFRRAVEASPTDGYSLRNLGAALLSRGHQEEALSYRRRA
jgi:Flp pilus assembly protein TadD